MQTQTLVLAPVCAKDRQTDRSDQQTKRISLMAKCTQTPRQPGMPIAQRAQGVLVQWISFLLPITVRIVPAALSLTA